MKTIVGSKTPDPLVPSITDPGAAGDTQTFDHTYAIGSGYEYCVTVDAETSEGFYPANTYVFTASSYTDPVNTISVGTTTPDTGYNFALVFEDGGTGTSSESYTIDWGDGTDTSASAVPNEFSSVIDHNYANSGVYNITVTGDDSGDVGSYQSNFAVAPPTLTSAGEQVTGPGQAVTLASFTGLTDSDANAEVDWGDGTGPHPGNILEDGTITADAPATPGVYTPTVTLYQPDADAGPGFVEYGGGLTSSVGVDTTVDVWGVEIDNGESNDLLIASSDGTQNLQPVTVYFPHPAGEALDLTLTSSDDTEDDVWDTETPTSGATPLLGNGVASASFTVSPTDSMEQTLWVGATQGDTTANVFSLSLSGSADSGASTSAFNSEVSAGELGATGATGVTGPKDKASDFYLRMLLNDWVGSNYLGSGTTDLQVGQYANLTASVIAPPMYTNPIFHWTVSGNVLHRYSPNNSRSNDIGLAPLEWDPTMGLSGTFTHSIGVFWASTAVGSTGIEADTVSLTATYLNLPGWPSFNKTNTFDISTPQSTEAVLQSGVSGLGTENGLVKLKLVRQNGALFPYGMVISGSVTDPLSSSWCFVQTVTDVHYGWLRNPPGGEYYYSLNGVPNMLDTTFPYLGVMPTGSESSLHDSPWQELNGTEFDLVDNSFTSYVMFMPYGAGSQWVPLKMVGWAWEAFASYDAAAVGPVKYTIFDSLSPPASYTSVTAPNREPVWTANFASDHFIIAPIGANP